MGLPILNNVRIYHYLLALLTLTFLSGCQTTGQGDKPNKVNMLPTLSRFDVPSPTMGTVVVRIVQAGGRLSDINQVTMVPKNYNGNLFSQKQRMSAMTETGSGSNIFASNVSPGKYSLANVRSFHYWGYYRKEDQFIDLDASFGTFDVKPGQVTDLGTLIYYQKPVEDKYIHQILRQPPQALGAIVKQLLPKYPSPLENVLTWDDDGKDDQRYEQFLSILQNPIEFSKRFTTKDQTRYFLASLGVMVTRSPAGEWSMESVDTNEALEDMAESKNGDLVISGSRGTVFLKPVGGEWQDYSLDSRKKIIFVGFREDGHLYSWSRSEQKLTLMHTAIDGSPNWQAIAEYDLYKGWTMLSGQPYVDTSFEKIRSKESPKMTYSVYDPERRLISFAVKKLPGYRHPSEKYNYNADVNTGRCWHSFEEPQKYLIFDGGKKSVGVDLAGFYERHTFDYYVKGKEADASWKKIEQQLYRCPAGFAPKDKQCVDQSDNTQSVSATPEKIEFDSTPVFYSDTEVRATIRETKGVSKDEVKFVLIQSHDGGQTWTTNNAETPKPYCHRLESSLTDRLLLSCSGFSGDFFESTDEGKTWQQVREQQAF